MADIQFSVNYLSGEDWSGTFSVDNLNTQITSILPLSLTTNNITFFPLDFGSQNSGTTSYVSWRSVNISENTPGPPLYLNIYPQSGYSFDVWSHDLYTDIEVNLITWDSIRGNSYNLNSSKNTIIYDYDNLNPIYFGTGGTISFSA
jgi:hypothetical protein